MVYNMGKEDHPIGELDVKVNDNTYHVVRFTRSGANSTLQLDDYNVRTKHPKGIFDNITFMYIKRKRINEALGICTKYFLRLSCTKRHEVKATAYVQISVCNDLSERRLGVFLPTK